MSSNVDGESKDCIAKKARIDKLKEISNFLKKCVDLI